MGRKLSYREWLVVCDELHPDLTERLAGLSLDLPERRTVIRAGRTDPDHSHILARPNRQMHGLS